VFFYGDVTTGDSPTSLFPDERLLCHALLEKLPDSIMPEALESLADIWRFRNTRMLQGGHDLPTREPMGRGRITTDRRADPVVIAEG
jgi:hypothetical protein